MFLTKTSKVIRLLSQTRANSNILKYGKVIQKSYRGIHSSTILFKKMFLEHENTFAFDIMKNKGYVTDFLAATRTDNNVSKDIFEKTLQEDWSKKLPAQLFEAFSVLGSYSSANGLCISNKMFDPFIDTLTDNINKASDQELRMLFYYLFKWPETESIRTRNYIEVWVALDDECLNRIKSWDFDEMLSFVTLFYMLNVTRVSDFSMKTLQKLASKSKQLTPRQLVQTMFFIGVTRRSPIDMHNLELHFNNLFTEFSMDELSVISMGFFKSKTPLRNMELISKISDEMIKHASDIHEVSLAALLKIVRYSAKVPFSKIYTLLDSLHCEVPRLSLMCNVHLALLGTATLTLHEKCLIDIANYAIANINMARMKDLERLIFTCGTFNLISNTECFVNKVVDELRKPERLPEIEKHGRSFACCVAFLGYLKTYPIDLMNKVLSPEFLQNTYGKQCMAYGREVLAIHNTAKIFCHEANMHRLSDKSAIILAKKYTDFIPSEDYVKQYNVSEKMFLDVMKIIKEVQGGENFVIGDHILTHHQRGDIIICNDQHGTPMEIKNYKTAPFGVMRRAPSDNNNWFALVIAGRNCIIQNTDKATGPFSSKVRELEELGYNAVLVPWTKYSTLDTKDAKIAYLIRLIDEAVNKKSNCEMKASLIK